MLWALWFKSAEHAAGGMALGKVSTSPRGNLLPPALKPSAKRLVEPVHQQHAARSVALQLPSQCKLLEGSHF